MTTQPAWVPLILGLSAKRPGCVEFFVDADTLYDGYVSFDGRTIGYLQGLGKRRLSLYSLYHSMRGGTSPAARG